MKEGCDDSRSILMLRNGNRQMDLAYYARGRSIMAARLMREGELGKVQALARQLWPDESNHVFDSEYVFVWEREDGAIDGFASVSIRPWVEGVDAMPCPHLEGWFVKAGSRQSGAGRALILAVEQWCRQRGFHILTSDTGLSNDVSLCAHKALGFTPTEQIQYFKKSL